MCFLRRAMTIKQLFATEATERKKKERKNKRGRKKEGAARMQMSLAMRQNSSWGTRCWVTHTPGGPCTAVMHVLPAGRPPDYAAQLRCCRRSQLSRPQLCPARKLKEKAPQTPESLRCDRLGMSPPPPTQPTTLRSLSSSISSDAPLLVWWFDREPPMFFRALIARHTVYYNGVSVVTKEVSRSVEKNKDIVLRTHQICSWSGSFVLLSAVLKPVLKDRGSLGLFSDFPLFFSAL